MTQIRESGKVKWLPRKIISKETGTPKETLKLGRTPPLQEVERDGLLMMD